MCGRFVRQKESILSKASLNLPVKMRIHYADLRTIFHGHWGELESPHE
jgi:hypothetical protein